MLRHACGYALADKGHDTRALGAKPVQGLVEAGVDAEELEAFGRPSRAFSRCS
jgi:hypothetical protein